MSTLAITTSEGVAGQAFPDLMIDLEALADTPNSAPFQAALVFFDRDDRTKGTAQVDIRISALSAMRIGFEVTTSTLIWWADKGADLGALIHSGVGISEALETIADRIRDHGKRKGLRVWSRGNSYDLSILKLAYRRCSLPLPWDHWEERDVRTSLDDLGFKSARDNNHDALQDALNQASEIVQARELRAAASPAPTLA